MNLLSFASILFSNTFKAILCGVFVMGYACSDDNADSERCEYHTECPIPERCIEGKCRLECRVSTDCTAGARCFEGVCYTRPEICRSDDECAPFQEVCNRQTLMCIPPGDLNSNSAGTEMTSGT